MGDKFVKIVENVDVLSIAKLGLAMACVQIMAEGATALACATGEAICRRVKAVKEKHDKDKEEKLNAAAANAIPVEAEVEMC